ncbi:FMRFamide peptide receptor frpr-18-like [Mytilus californianus]|uniref:FMRFamide peptide receptor frpr-18-like n=1 Tax=Mytilus californianus TaxID=6549 RepID=UPI002246D447|nr:FMRFamide peptide receptor frpr-18-like [Mytilus californianus]
MDLNGTNKTLLAIGQEPAKWGFWIQEIITPIIVVVGICGNVMSFLLMKTKSLRRKSYSHFLCALAVFDSLCLINRQITLIHEMMVDNEKDGVFTYYSDLSCQLFSFYEHVCYLMSSWLIVGMAAERGVAMCLPFRKTLIRTQTGAFVTIMSTFVVMCFTQTFRFIMMKNIGGLCQGNTYTHPEYIELHIYFYQLTLVLTLPFLLVLVCNTLVIYQIYCVRKAAVSLTLRSRVVARSHKTTVMLLAIAFTYLITMLPLVVISFIWMVAMENSNVRMFFSLYPIQQFVSVISHCNYGVNFFIYILSGRSFRFELRRIFSLERRSTISTTKTREEIMRLQ